MAFKVLIDGEFVPDEGYERGWMVLYSDEEWRRRSLATLWRYSLREWVIMYAWAMLVPLFLTILLSFFPRQEALLWIVAVMVIGLTLLFLLLVLVDLRALRRGRLIGLYERGVQVTWSRFVPYSGVTRVERTTFGPKEWQMVEVHVSGQDVPEDDLMVPLTLLGEEGMEELESRVHRPGSPEWVYDRPGQG